MKRKEYLFDLILSLEHFSSRGTYGALIIVWRNQNIQNSTNYSAFKEPSKNVVAEPLGSTEPGLKSTVAQYSRASICHCNWTFKKKLSYLNFALFWVF